MVGDVLGDVGRTDSLGVNRRVLLVDRADLDALIVAQYRAIDGAGYVVFSKLRRAADVDDFVKFTEIGGVFDGDNAIFHAAILTAAPVCARCCRAGGAVLRLSGAGCQPGTAWAQWQCLRAEKQLKPYFAVLLPR